MRGRRGLRHRPKNDTKWISAIKWAERVGDGGFGAGSRVAREAGFYGLLPPLLSLAVRRAIERGVGRLRRVLEARHP